MHCVVGDGLGYGAFLLNGLPVVKAQRSTQKFMYHQKIWVQGRYGYRAGDAYTRTRTHTHTCF